jgi:hypothetical protein
MLFPQIPNMPPMDRENEIKAIERQTRTRMAELIKRALRETSMIRQEAETGWHMAERLLEHKWNIAKKLRTGSRNAVVSRQEHEVAATKSLQMATDLKVAEEAVYSTVIQYEEEIGAEYRRAHATRCSMEADFGPFASASPPPSTTPSTAPPATTPLQQIRLPTVPLAPAPPLPCPLASGLQWCACNNCHQRGSHVLGHKGQDCSARRGQQPQHQQPDNPEGVVPMEAAMQSNSHDPSLNQNDQPAATIGREDSLTLMSFPPSKGSTTTKLVKVVGTTLPLEFHALPVTQSYHLGQDEIIDVVGGGGNPGQC